MAGVPHELVRKVVLGGRYVTRVVGAVPVIVVLGLFVAVPPVMLEVAPITPVPSSDQVVTKVNTLPPTLSATVVLINSGV